MPNDQFYLYNFHFLSVMERDIVPSTILILEK